MRTPDDEIPRWARMAAQILYDQMERIDGEAMNDGQVEHDPEAERSTWTRLVAEIIASEFVSEILEDAIRKTRGIAEEERAGERIDDDTLEVP